MHPIFCLPEIFDIMIRIVFLDIFQDNVNYLSYAKKKKAIKTHIKSLLCINKYFYNVIREYNYYFIFKFTIKENIKREVRQEITEAVKLTLDEIYTMKNFNTFKKYKRDNGLITEYSRYCAMYYYTLYLEKGFEDKKNSRSILKWYRLCALYGRVPEYKQFLKKCKEYKEEIIDFCKKQKDLKIEEDMDDDGINMINELVIMIVSYLYDMDISLFNCIMVSRTWARIAIPILWQDPLGYCHRHYEAIGSYYKNLKNVDSLKRIIYYNLNDKEQIILQKYFPDKTYSNTLFNYLSYVKLIDTKSIVSLINKKVIKTITHLFLRKSNIIKIINIAHIYFSDLDLNKFDNIDNLKILNLSHINFTFDYSILFKKVLKIIRLDLNWVVYDENLYKNITILQNLRYLTLKDSVYDIDEILFIIKNMKKIICLNVIISEYYSRYKNSMQIKIEKDKINKINEEFKKHKSLKTMIFKVESENIYLELSKSQ
ncbi:15063_t:CDS:2, partial [Cetraspora pellucida]